MGETGGAFGVADGEFVDGVVVVSVGFDHLGLAVIAVGVVVLVCFGGWPFQVGYEACGSASRATAGVGGL